MKSRPRSRIPAEAAVLISNELEVGKMRELVLAIKSSPSDSISDAEKSRVGRRSLASSEFAAGKLRNPGEQAPGFCFILS